MLKDEAFISALAGRFGTPVVAAWRARCRPRILILVDGLDYTANAFGLQRFLEAITLAPGIVKPILTLADRFFHPTPTVTIGADVYTVVNNFNFATAATPVTLANYDQIWIFGFDGSPFSLTYNEVTAVSRFMNGGGGVFATGDHGSLGRALSGSLPRIRYMREWRDELSGGVPMGGEADVNLAVMRIDTVVNPGANNVYEFDDQSDNIPQRIYPNYPVVDTDGGGGTGWTATVHPVLMLPGAPTVRTTSADFTNDLDVLPDHPHESQCYEVTDGAVLDGIYNNPGSSPSSEEPGFEEFPRFDPDSKRVRPVLVAYAVAGGRSVNAGIWKPPVRPRMFGVISAYDGRLAMPYPGNVQPPGRIVSESTWHHYVNINIDGTGSPHTGLGTGTGAGFVPGADLVKIRAYWNNTVTWLQPANRIWCSMFWELAEARFHPALYEELLSLEQLAGWRGRVGIGREARRLSAARSGRGQVTDHLLGLLTASERFAPARAVVAQVPGGPLTRDGMVEVAEARDRGEGATGDAFDRDELLDGIYGALLIELARLLPVAGDPAATREAVAAGPGPYIDRLEATIADAIKQGSAYQRERLERGMATADALNGMR